MKTLNSHEIAMISGGTFGEVCSKAYDLAYDYGINMAGGLIFTGLLSAKVGNVCPISFRGEEYVAAATVTKAALFTVGVYLTDTVRDVGERLNNRYLG